MWNDPPRGQLSIFCLNLQAQQQLCLFFRLKEFLQTPWPPLLVPFHPDRQVGSSFSSPIKILLVSATPVLQEGQGRAYPSFLTDLPALDCQSFQGNGFSGGCLCVHSTLPQGQVPSDESVRAFEIVRETDFLVKSRPVQLEGQILLSCQLPRRSKAADKGLKRWCLACFNLSSAQHGEGSWLSASLNSLISPPLWANR